MKNKSESNKPTIEKSLKRKRSNSNGSEFWLNLKGESNRNIAPRVNFFVDSDTDSDLSSPSSIATPYQDKKEDTKSVTESNSSPTFNGYKLTGKQIHTIGNIIFQLYGSS